MSNDDVACCGSAHNRIEQSSDEAVTMCMLYIWLATYRKSGWLYFVIVDGYIPQAVLAACRIVAGYVP
jgi:hypothetical protein